MCTEAAGIALHTDDMFVLPELLLWSRYLYVAIQKQGQFQGTLIMGLMLFSGLCMVGPTFSGFAWL